MVSRGGNGTRKYVWDLEDIFSRQTPGNLAPSSRGAGQMGAGQIAEIVGDDQDAEPYRLRYVDGQQQSAPLPVAVEVSSINPAAKHKDTKDAPGKFYIG